MAATQVASLFGTLDLVDNFTGPLTNAQGMLQGFGNRLTGAGQAVTRFGASMLPITIPLTLIGKTSLSTAADFDSAMAEISARTGITGKDLERVAEFALQMGADTSFSAQQAADAFLQLLSSGQTVEEAIATLPTVLDLAAASGEDLGFTADSLTDIMAEFGLGIEDAAAVADVLAQAAGASSAEVGMLSQGFANVGPVAKAFGMDVTDTAATLAVLSENGIKGAEAGTALKSMLLNMTRPTEEVQGAWEMLGLSFYDAEGKARPLAEVVRDLDSALDTKTAEEQNEIMTTLAGSYGIVALQALRGELSIEEMNAMMSKQASAADVAAARMNTFKGRVDSLKGSVETLMIRAFTPFMNNVLSPLVGKLIPIVNTIAAWTAANPALTSTIIAIGTGLVAISSAALILGPILTFIGAGFGALGVALTLALSPIGLLVVAVVGLYAAWQTNFMGIRDITSEVIGSVQSWISVLRSSFTFGGAISAVSGAIRGLTSAAAGFIALIPGWLIPGSPTPFEIGLRGIASAVLEVASAFQGMGLGPIVSGAGILLSILSRWFPWLSSLKIVIAAVGVAFAAWQTNFMGIRDTLGPLASEISTQLSGLGDLATEALASLPDVLTAVGDALGLLARLYGPALSRMFTALGRAVRATASVFKTQIIPVLKQMAPIIGGLILVSVYLLIEGVTALANAWAGFAKDHPKLAAGIIGIAAAIGAIMIVMGPIAAIVGAVSAAFATFGTVIGIVGFVMADAILGPIILVVGALALLGIAYKENFLGFGDAVRAVAGWLKDAFIAATTFISGIVAAFQQGGLSAVGQYLKDQIVIGLGNLTAWATTHIVTPIKTTLTGASWAGLVAMGTAILNGILPAWSALDIWVYDHFTSRMLSFFTNAALLLQNNALAIGDNILTGILPAWSALDIWVFTNFTDRFNAFLANGAVTLMNGGAATIGANILTGILTGLGDLGAWANDHIIQPIANALASAALSITVDIIPNVLGDLGGTIAGTATGLVNSVLGKASGGPVRAGTPYVVGEKGPELFMPGTNGRIVPNAALSGTGGGITIGNLNVYGVQNVPQLMDELRKELSHRAPGRRW